MATDSQGRSFASILGNPDAPANIQPADQADWHEPAGIITEPDRFKHLRPSRTTLAVAKVFAAVGAGALVAAYQGVGYLSPEHIASLQSWGNSGIISAAIWSLASVAEGSHAARVHIKRERQDAQNGRAAWLADASLAQIMPFLDANATHEAVAQCVDPESGLHLVRGAGERVFRAVGKVEFKQFCLDVERSLGVLNMLDIHDDGADAPRITIRRYDAGVLHGSTPDCPAVVSLTGDRLTRTWVSAGHRVAFSTDSVSAMADGTGLELPDSLGTDPGGLLAVARHASALSRVLVAYGPDAMEGQETISAGSGKFY